MALALLALSIDCGDAGKLAALNLGVRLVGSHSFTQLRLCPAGKLCKGRGFACLLPRSPGRHTRNGIAEAGRCRFSVG